MQLTVSIGKKNDGERLAKCALLGQGNKSISRSSSLNKMHLVPARIERSFAHIPNAVREQLFPHTWQRFWSPWDHGSAIRNSSSRTHRRFYMCTELSTTNRDIIHTRYLYILNSFAHIHISSEFRICHTEFTY